MENFFYNIFCLSDFETELVKFKCVLTEEKVKNKKLSTITHISEIKEMLPSIIFEGDGKSILEDYSLLLSVFQGNYIFYDNHNFLPCLNKINDFELFLSDEIGDFLDISIKNLTKLKKENIETFEIIRRSLFLYYEARFLMIYNENCIINLIHLSEFLLGSIYRIDKNITDEENIFIDSSFPYICEKFKYNDYIDSNIKLEIKGKLSIFKKEKNVKSIKEFKDQFREMRNWIQHGKQQKKPTLENSPSDFEFTFNYRLKSFIRLILASLVYGKDFKRKFDILYQLILEKNVCFIPTPDINIRK